MNNKAKDILINFITNDTKSLSYHDTFDIFSDILAKKLYDLTDIDMSRKINLSNITADNFVVDFYDYCVQQEKKPLNVVKFSDYKRK